MFHQNSNDLVKNASVTSGHIQNSSGTREVLMKQVNVNASDDGMGTGAGTGAGTAAGGSLSIGAKFQNMIQGLIDGVSLKEGLGVAGAVGGGGDAAVDIAQKQTAKHTQQVKEHNERVANIMKLIDEGDKNSRQKWVEVTDSAGVTKYGYITKDGIFQIWNAPASPPTTEWFQTDKIKQNAGVLGCPAASGSIQKHKIAGTWETIKPFDMVYAAGDSGRKNPLFLLVNDAVRDPKNSVNGMGMFSCGNERGNVYVSQRPSADFHVKDPPVPMGCYVIADNIKDIDITNRGFTFQDDLTEASISQCKRRAEDLGSSYFLVSAPQPGKPNNRGGCWIYTGSGEPNIKGMLILDETAGKCHTVANAEDDEDGYMKAYTTTNLKRIYGKDATVNVPINPPNPECDHTTRSRCIFKSYKHSGGGTCYPSNGNGTWAYGGLYNYNKQQLKGWLNALHDRNADGLERDSVNEYIEKCKNTEGYEFLDDNPSQRTKIERSVALYALKSGGPTGVDKNGSGSIGKIAYIDHNGERHEYPESALSFMKPSKNEAGETLPASYVNLGGYDTRSAESSYSLKEITPGSFSEASNLLYKASRDGWTPAAFHQRCDNKGATYTRAVLTDGRELGGYTSLSWDSNAEWKDDTTAFLYDGTRKYTTEKGHWEPGKYATYMNAGYFPTFGGGHDMYIGGNSMYINAYSFVTGNDRSAPFNRKGWGAHEQHNLKDIEVYSVDANIFPKTNPPDYARRLKTMPVGESITASMEKCRGMCDADEACGGFVYTKSGGVSDGKCELKDRAKMYPIGLRVADPTKQLMMKVPTINETIGDQSCKVGNGKYAVIDSAQYAHYPDTGAMSTGTKCKINDIIPSNVNTQMPDVTQAIVAVNEVTKDTAAKTADYRAQTTASKESFTGFREGMAGDISGGNYADTMTAVQGDLKKIANAEYQRERIHAMTEESNKLLIAESYKFILWSILAILAVMALLKLKEMFGQDDVDADDGGGGLFAYILGLFGVGSVKTDDIADRTGDVKEALSSAGEQLKEAGENLTTGITEGADNLVSSANEAAAGAVESAKGLADKVSETATDAVNKVGDAVGSAAGAPPAATGAGTGGRGRHTRNSGKK